MIKVELNGDGGLAEWVGLNDDASSLAYAMDRDRDQVGSIGVYERICKVAIQTIVETNNWGDAPSVAADLSCDYVEGGNGGGYINSVFVAYRRGNVVTVCFNMGWTDHRPEANRDICMWIGNMALPAYFDGMKGCRDSMSLKSMGDSARYNAESNDRWAARFEIDGEFLTLVHEPGVALDWLEDRGLRGLPEHAEKFGKGHLVAGFPAYLGLVVELRLQMGLDQKASL